MIHGFFFVFFLEFFVMSSCGFFRIKWIVVLGFGFLYLSMYILFLQNFTPRMVGPFFFV